MPNIKVIKPFPFSPDGKTVIEIEVGEQVVSDRCALVAVEHLKVATLLEEGGKPSEPAAAKSPAGDPEPEKTDPSNLESKTSESESEKAEEEAGSGAAAEDDVQADSKPSGKKVQNAKR